MFRAFRHRPYRLFFIGQCISVVGTWMQSVAQQWLVYRLTGSAALLGVVAFSSQIPVPFLAPFAGVMADRHDKRRIIVATQVGAMLLAATLATLTFTEVVRPWHIVILAGLLGVMNAFDIPTRQSFFIEMVGREDLSNAIALNSSMFNGARFLGPAIAGVIVAAWGEGFCFAANAVSYIAVIAALLRIRVERRPSEAGSGSVTEHMLEGLRYIREHLPVKALLLLLGWAGMTGASFTTLVPVFAKDVLGGGPRTLGLLVGSVGLGAFLGAVSLARRSSVLGLGRVTGTAALLFGVVLVAFAFSPWLWLSSLLLAGVGFAMMTQMTGTNTLIQNLVSQRIRGRVMSFYASIFIGSVPLGSLLAGAAAERIGAPRTVAIGGVLCALGGAVFLRMLPRLREQGIRMFVEAGAIKPAEAPI